MGRAAGLSIFGLLPLMLCAQNPTGQIATWKDNADGAYTIIHDDYGDTGVDGIWRYADTICSNRGVKFTFGAISERCEETRNVNGYSSPYEYAKQVMMAQHDHEIMSHSHSHDCAVGNAGWSPCDANVGEAWGEDVGSANFNTQLVTAHNSITTNTGFAPKYYIFPYDRFTDAANDKLKDLGYLGSRTGWTSPRVGDVPYHRNGYENNDLNTFFPDADGFFRGAVQVFDANDQALDANDQTNVLNGEVDVAIANSEWANRELHNVGTTGWGSVKVDAYRAHINYVQSKMSTGELWVGTVSELMTYQMQKLKYSPQVTYDNGSDKVFVTWASINPQYNVDMASYLSPLTIKTPITLIVDLDGMGGTWSVLQNSTPVNDVNQVGTTMYINVYPHEGDLEIYKSGTLPNQDPYVDNAINDYTLAMNFADFNINLENVFEDLESADGDLAFFVSGNTNVLVSITNGVATVSSTNGWTGNETITITAEDEGGLTVSDIFSVTVSDIFQGQTPYGGVAHAIPGRLEAEEYDEGSEGFAYHEVATNYEPDPADNPFRPNSDPDVEALSGPGYGVGYTEDGEWMEYTVDVAATGWYIVIFRVAQKVDQWNTPVGQSRLLIDNQELMPTHDMVYTSEWTNYQDVEYPFAVKLTEGTHVLRFEAVRGSSNLDYIDILDSPTNSSDDIVVASHKVYPNPASSDLNIEGDFNTAFIYNQTGELVMTTSDAKVNLEGIAEGVYYVKLDNSNGMVKFVKTK